MNKYLKILKKFFSEKKNLLLIISILITLLFFLIKFWAYKEVEKTENFYNNGILLIEEDKNYEKAIEQFNLYLNEDPRSSEAYFSKGYCLYMLGDYNTAIKYLKKSQEIDPISPETCEYLALSKINTKEINKTEDALQLTENAGIMIKSDSYSWSKLKEIHLESKGWIYYKAGYLTKALKLYGTVIPLYEKAFEKDLNEYDECFSPVHYHFGMIYKHKGDLDKAKSEFEKAINAGGPQSIFSKKSKEELDIINNIEVLK